MRGELATYWFRKGSDHETLRGDAEAIRPTRHVVADAIDEGRKLWRKFHATRFEKGIRDEFKLNRPDDGWYHVRRALEATAGNEAVDFDPFKAAYGRLSLKLRPQVFTLGVLRA